MSVLFELLAELNHARVTAGRVTVLIISVHADVPPLPHSTMVALQSALRAIVDLCDHVCVALEETKHDRARLRAAFYDVDSGASERRLPLFFDSLDLAITYAQRFAPHDVLELQRRALRRSSPPNGQWT